jgi:diketogulonate reductase-like aldo/keto reductase
MLPSAATGLAVPSSAVAADETSITSAVASINPIATLADGSKFPLVSFGLQIYDDAMAYKLTMTALESGYRNFFASVLAGNQRGFAKAIQDSQLPRSELYICGSVVSNRVSGFGSARKETTKGWKRNMEAFGVGGIDYLDQIMLDYPGMYQLFIIAEMEGTGRSILSIHVLNTLSFQQNRPRL